MIEGLQALHREPQHAVGWHAIAGGDEPHAAGIMLEVGVVDRYRGGRLLRTQSAAGTGGHHGRALLSLGGPRGGRKSSRVVSRGSPSLVPPAGQG